MRKYKILLFNFNPNAPINLYTGFEELGYDVINFVSNRKNKYAKLLKKTLDDLINSFKPDVIISLGYWISFANIETFARVIRRHGILHAYWAIDDPDLYHAISLPMAKKADLVFTTDKDCIPKYKEEGLDAYFLIYGCNPAIQKKIEPVDEFRHDLVLLAHNYNNQRDPSYFGYRLNGINNVLRPVVEKNYDLKVWGLWWNDPAKIYLIPDNFYGGVLPSGNEAKVYSSAKIVLGFQTVGSTQSMISLRTFETLCCGAFHISQYSPGLEHYFKKGEHLEWSKSPGETLELVDFYLKNGDIREKIALQGQQEVLRKHTMKHRALTVIEVLEKYLS